MVVTSVSRRSSAIVLHVSAHTIEALVPRKRRVAGALRHRLVRFSHALEMGAELAAFIGVRLKAHGVSRRPVVLALSPQFVSSKIIELPSLGARDLESVVGRKAAAQLDRDPGDVAFSAIALDGEDAAEKRWLIHCCPKDSITEFQMELRSIGFPVKHAIPARTAPFLATRCLDVAAKEGATLVALFEREHCAVGLLAEGRLVHLSTLQGGTHSHLTEPQTARAFVQELRGIDAFWRRSNRGDRVTAVVVGGVEPFVVERLEAAIRSALGEVGIYPMEDDGHGAPRGDGTLAVDGLDGLDEDEDGGTSPLDDPGERARITLLTSLSGHRVASLDLAVDLRPRARDVIAVGGASMLVFGTIAMSLRTELESQAASLATEAQVVHAASADLEELESAAEEARSIEAQIEAACSELQSVSRLGLSARRLVEGVFASFDGSTQVLAVAASSGSTGATGGVMRLNGAVIDEPGVTARALSRLEAELHRVPGVRGVSIEMPSLGDRAGDLRGQGRRSLRFSAALVLGTGTASPGGGH